MTPLVTRHNTYSAEVLGRPYGMGSKRIGRTHDGRPIILDAKDGALRAWQADLRAALRAGAPPVPFNGPVCVFLDVVFARPASHYRTGKYAGELKPTAPGWAAVGLDLDKIQRAVGDCLTGIWVVDDARIARWKPRKRYPGIGEAPRTVVKMWSLEEQAA